MKISPLITLLTLSLSTAAFADNDVVPFTTLEQAEQYCPPINALTFTPNSSSVPHSAGNITGTNQLAFASVPVNAALSPKNLDSNGFVTDVQFRSSNGIYGYSSNNVITCLYAYPTFTDAAYALVLRSH